MSTEVFDAIADFLQFCGMNSTLAVFQSERLSCPPIEEIARRRNNTQAEFKQDIINSLSTGDVQRFRSLWGSKWQAAPDQTAQKLLFRCEIFFAVFPLHPANRVKFGDIHESLQRFREFLDTHQSDLSQSTEFLPFYALPYIPNPADHPSFKKIFTVAWFDDLKRQLNEWLDRQLVGAQMPILITALQSPTEQIASTDSELWSVALELADALQHAEHGDIPPHEYISSLFARIGIFPGGAVKFTATTDFSPLDFAKVTKDLEKPDLSAPLLKACVNRLTRAPTEHIKRFYVELISGDIFKVKSDLLSKLLSTPGPVKSYTLRLLNILATDPPGRQYIFKYKKLIDLLMPILSEDDSDDLMNTVGILQKLSFMKDAKTQFIKAGVLDAILKLLADPSRLSDYTGDYAAALAMSLCMRKESAKKCINNDALSIFAELSGTASQQQQFYAMAALSELFAKEPKLREKAKSLGLPALFEKMRSSATDPGNIDQFNYVIKAMNGEIEDTGDDDADADDDANDNGSVMFDAYDEVGNEQWDFEVEGEALLAKYVITTGEATKAKEQIDKSLRDSQSRMSISLGGSKSSSRRPFTPNSGHK